MGGAGAYNVSNIGGFRASLLVLLSPIGHIETLLMTPPGLVYICTAAGLASDGPRFSLYSCHAAPVMLPLSCP